MMRKIKIKTVLIHLVFWACMLLALNTVFHLRLHHVVQGHDMEPMVYSYDIVVYRSLLYGVSFKIILFYVNTFYLLRNYSSSKNAVKYVFQFLLLVGICYGLDFALRYYKNQPFRNINDQDVVDYVTRMNMVFYALVIGLSFIYFFFNEWLRNEKIKNNLIREQLSNELNLLKFQINPHFLFNTLNNLFSIAQEHGDVELKSGIFNLSGIMRYILYDSNSSITKLQKEIDYVEDFIDIHKLKYTPEDDINIGFAIQGEPNNKCIAPMLLIPFVENAFKHGVSLKKRSIIDIKLTVRENDLFFSVVNTNHSYINKSPDTGSGIGLNNVQKRLDLLYGNNYFLKINSTDMFYSVELTLPVNLPL